MHWPLAGWSLFELILWIIQKETGGQFSLLSKYQKSPRIKDKHFMLALWGSDVET